MRQVDREEKFRSKFPIPEGLQFVACSDSIYSMIHKKFDVVCIYLNCQEENYSRAKSVLENEVAVILPIQDILVLDNSYIFCIHMLDIVCCQYCIKILLNCIYSLLI